MENSIAVDLSKNENFLGPNPVVIRTLSDLTLNLAVYPSITGEHVRKIIARYHGVKSGQVVLGNGSVGLLDIAVRAVLSPGDEVLVPQSTFSEIPRIIHSYGACVVYVHLKNWLIDLEASLSSVGTHTRLICIVNPNNPTGTLLTREEIVDFMKRLPSSVFVIVDEAYIDYVSDEKKFTVIDLVTRFDNLIVTRTFSKAHGLAALRIGYCLASQDIIKRIQSYRLPFSNNTIALQAAALSIQDQDYLIRVRDFNKAGLQQLLKGLDDLGLSCIKSVANFISIDFGEDAEMVFNYLKEKGVILAPQNDANMPGYLRLTVGNKEQNTAVLSLLKQCYTPRPGGVSVK